MRSLAFVFIVTFSLPVLAQEVRGRVLDNQTSKPLPFTNVYVNNTTIGTVSNESGEFLLELSTGQHDLIVSFVGYHTARFNLLLGPDGIDLGVIRLMPEESELAPVIVSAKQDKNWEKNLTRFKRTFLGRGKEAKKCIINNPWVVEFQEHQPDYSLSAFSSAPIEIENHWLGYRIFYDLRQFTVVDHLPSRVGETRFSFTGFVRFEELDAASEKERLTWKENRERAYTSSYMFFFRSILERNMQSNGFKTLEDNRVNNQPPSEVNENWFYPVSATVQHASVSSEEQTNRRLIVRKWIEIHRRNNGLFNSISQLHVKGDTVLVNAAGFPLNPEKIDVTGDWFAHRISRLLPTNYSEPNASLSTKAVQGHSAKMAVDDVSWYERIYVQTDKPYYYAGEPVWLKGYLKYSSPHVIDSLSQVAYVELLNAEKRVLLTRTIQIDSGLFHNDFQLPDSIPSGQYYLRAYTNLSLNFGAAGQFIKELPVLALNEQVEPLMEVMGSPEDSSIVITADRSRYNTRERITVNILVRDSLGIPLTAHLAISVTDARQVVPVVERWTITNTMSKTDSIDATTLKLRYPIERTLRFDGLYTNAKGIADSTGFDVMQWNPPALATSCTNSRGEFSLQGYSFYDTMVVSLKSTKSKGPNFGRFEIRQHAAPPFPSGIEYQLPVRKTTTSQGLIKYKTWRMENKLLDAVVVSAKRIKPLNRYAARADFMLTGDDLGSGGRDLAVALQAKVPGLSIQFGGTKKEFGANGVTMEYMEPVFTYFGRPIGIGHVYASGDEIESILFFRGSISRPPTMMINWKPERKQALDPDFQSLKLKGYDTPREFTSPSYEQPAAGSVEVDYRSTIYWNPGVVTHSESGTAKVSFWSADFPTTYRIVVEGITQNGVTVRKVAFLDVGND